MVTGGKKRGASQEKVSREEEVLVEVGKKWGASQGEVCQDQEALVAGARNVGHLNVDQQKSRRMKKKKGWRNPRETVRYTRQKIPFRVQIGTLSGNMAESGSQSPASLSHCDSCPQQEQWLEERRPMLKIVAGMQEWINNKTYAVTKSWSKQQKDW